MTNPLHLSCILLLLGLPGIRLLGLQLTNWVCDEPPIQRVLAPGVGLSAWLIAVIVIARAAESFTVGLWAGTLLAGGLGLVMQRASKRTAAQSPRRSPEAGGGRMLLIGLILTVPIAFLAIQGNFFDEFVTTGHRAQVAQFQNDVFPPRHLIFPAYLLRYHYGFNVVAAAFTATLRIPVAAALDALVISGFLWSWCLAWRLGERLGGSGSGLWAALGSLYGGGALYWLLWLADWGSHPALGPVIGGNRVNLPVVMYFFQKPFALGWPLALAVLLTVSYRPPDPGGRLQRNLTLALLLGALSIAQTVLFATVGACVVVHELLADRRWRALAAPAAAVVIAALMGGALFSRLPADSTELIRWRFWPSANEPLDILVWYGLTSGLLLPVGLAGLAVISRLRVLLLLLIAGSFATPLLFTNPFAPWDMLKFAAIGQFAGGLLAGCVLAALARGAGRRRIAAFALLVPLLVSSFGHLAAWARELVRPTSALGELLLAESTLVRSEDWDELISWLRDRKNADRLIHTDNYRLLRQLSLAGLGVSGPPRPIDREFGIPAQRIEARRRLLDERPDDLRLWRAEGILLFALLPQDVKPAEDNDDLDGETDPSPYARWVNSGELREVKRFGFLTLYEIDVSMLAP